MAIEVSGGIAWQKAPSVELHPLRGSDGGWYAGGIERVETPGTEGWRHSERTVYLQGDNSWAKTAYYFPTEEAADKALREALDAPAQPNVNDISSFQLALQRAKEEKARRGKR